MKWMSISTPATSQEMRKDVELAEAIRERLRNVLVFQTRVDLVPWGSLVRSECKSKLVEFCARPESASADSGRATIPKARPLRGRDVGYKEID
jgi:hypothetical protein